jgi:signal transduction histidine kinase
MEERAKLAGGELRIESSPGSGTRIVVFFTARVKTSEEIRA